MRRIDHPCTAKVRITCCSCTVSTLAIMAATPRILRSLPVTVQPIGRPQVGTLEASHFDPGWYTLTDR